MTEQITLGEAADLFEPTSLKSVADLEHINVSEPILEDSEAKFPYRYIERDNVKYKVPNSVLEAMKDIKAEIPEATDFKVTAKGEGMKKKYSVIPITL